MSLEDPDQKDEQKRGSAGSYIALTDIRHQITKKIKRAVTDSGSEVRAVPDKPALTNLLGIYSLLSNESIAEIEDRYAGKGYGAFKSDLATIMVDVVRPIREKLLELEADPGYAISVLATGAERAGAIAIPKWRSPESGWDCPGTSPSAQLQGWACARRRSAGASAPCDRAVRVWSCLQTRCRWQPIRNSI